MCIRDRYDTVIIYLYTKFNFQGSSRYFDGTGITAGWKKTGRYSHRQIGPGTRGRFPAKDIPNIKNQVCSWYAICSALGCIVVYRTIAVGCDLRTQQNVVSSTLDTCRISQFVKLSLFW